MWSKMRGDSEKIKDRSRKQSRDTTTSESEESDGFHFLLTPLMTRLSESEEEA